MRLHSEEEGKGPLSAAVTSFFDLPISSNQASQFWQGCGQGCSPMEPFQAEKSLRASAEQHHSSFTASNLAC